MLSVFNNFDDTQLDKSLISINIKDMLTNINNVTVGNIAITYLAKLTKLQNLTQQDLATKLGATRQTIAQRFHKQTMNLDDYINTAQAIGANPADILQQAINIHNQQAESALAGEG